MDRSGDLPACFDLYFIVGNRPGYVAAGSDQQALADDEIPLDAAAHVGVLGRTAASENAALGDDHILAIWQVRFDRALDDEAIARTNIARE